MFNSMLKFFRLFILLRICLKLQQPSWTVCKIKEKLVSRKSATRFSYCCLFVSFLMCLFCLPLPPLTRWVCTDLWAWRKKELPEDLKLYFKEGPWPCKSAYSAGSLLRSTAMRALLTLPWWFNQWLLSSGLCAQEVVAALEVFLLLCLLC